MPSRVVFLRKDSPVCRSEGFSSHNRILLSAGQRHAIATLYQVEGDFLGCDEAGLSDATWRLLGIQDGDRIKARHAPPVESLGSMRGRIYGHAFDEAALHQIVADIVAGRYSAIEISAFITACAARPLSHAEICALTRAMVNTGDRLSWDAAVVGDKHSVGGLPGNRTSPIIVAICAELGLVMPKTSSRAITSPAGTADTMETLAPVALDEKAMRDVVAREGGCVVWGGSIDLSPADDILIRIERALDIDSEGQMIASVLSKKVAAGATHLVIDMPVGPTAKVRSPQAAQLLSGGLLAVASAFGLNTRIVPGDGSQPIGRGIGPALEARDVLAVLQGQEGAPQDLRDARSRAGRRLAGIERQGRRWRGRGNGGRDHRQRPRLGEIPAHLRSPGRHAHPAPLHPSQGYHGDARDGIVGAIDNRRLSRLAKLAGAPEDKAAGIELHVRVGDNGRARRPASAPCMRRPPASWPMRWPMPTPIPTSSTSASHDTPACHARQ